MWFKTKNDLTLGTVWHQKTCLGHLLGLQKMTRIVLIDETFIPHNLPFCASV